MKSLKLEKFLTVWKSKISKSSKIKKFSLLRISKEISKKAQVGQIITYLLAIVIFAMVLIFGYNAVVNIRQQTDQVVYLAFQKSLEADIKSISFDYGSVKKKSYSVSGYETICFADLDALINPDPLPDDIPKIVINSMESKIKKNVFLVNGKIDSFYVGKIWLGDPIDPVYSPYKNPLCIPIVNGKLSITLTGQGDSTLIE